MGGSNIIHIVSHAYAETLPQYAVFLRIQLSSLVLNKPNVDFKITVCYTESDTLIFDVLQDFQDQLKGHLRTLRMDKGALFRRSIGRNYVAKNTDADLVWHSDVDHFWLQNCLDDLWGVRNGLITNCRPILMWPRTLLVQSSHQDGDELIEKKAVRGVLLPDITKFAMKRNYRAIGGIQIVDGDFSRKYGYLDGSKKWQSRVDETKPFPNFRDDVHFRNQCAKHGSSMCIELGGLYRLRHSKVTYK